MKVTRVKSLHELNQYLQGIPDTLEYNLINYVWLEYGFYPIFFNELFHDFFTQTSGPKLGICFEGHEIFYENLVDELVVLEKFIDTTKAYKDNKETQLLLDNFKGISDRGVAFWYTIRNFNEDEYDSVIGQFKFKNTIHPIGRDTPWTHGLFSLKKYRYATGEKDWWTSEDTPWITTKTLGWKLGLWKADYYFEDVMKLDQKYCAFFIKNTWKSRNFRSGNIGDILVGNGTGGKQGFGFMDLNFYDKLIKKFIEEKRYLVIITDLVKYPIPKNEYVKEFDMVGFFDTKRFLSVVHNSKVFITAATSPLDLAAYYCNTNLVLLDDRQNKNSFASKVCGLKGKKSIAYNFNEDFNIINGFIDKVV